MDNKKLLIENFRKQKKTYKEISDIFGLTTQRIHQIYKDYKPTKRSIVNYIRERDGYICRAGCNNCDGKNLQVHHLDGEKLNNSFENLLLVCRKCHSDLEKVLHKAKPPIERFIHRRKIKTIICEYCNKEFNTNSIKKFCSRNCFLNSIRKYKDKREGWRILFKKWYEKHKDNEDFKSKVRVRNKKWCENNRNYFKSPDIREKINSRNRERYKSDSEFRKRLKDKCQKYYEKNKIRLNNYRRNYYQQNNGNPQKLHK